jgi:hypothetical protein
MLITEAFHDMKQARTLIEKLTGQPWIWSAIRGRAGIAKAQLRQKLGLDSGHPGTRRRYLEEQICATRADSVDSAELE